MIDSRAVTLSVLGIVVGCSGSPNKPVTSQASIVAPRAVTLAPGHYRLRYQPIGRFWDAWSLGKGHPWQLVTDDELLWYDSESHAIVRRLKRGTHVRNGDGSLLQFLDDPAHNGTLLRFLDSSGNVTKETQLEGMISDSAKYLISFTSPESPLLVSTSQRNYAISRKTGTDFAYPRCNGQISWISPDGSRLLVQPELDEPGKLDLYRLKDSSLVRTLKFKNVIDQAMGIFSQNSSYFYLDYPSFRGVFESATGQRLLAGITPFDDENPFANDNSGIWVLRGQQLELLSLPSGRSITKVLLPQLSCPGPVWASRDECSYQQQHFSIDRAISARAFEAHSVLGKELLVRLSVDADRQQSSLFKIAKDVTHLATMTPDGTKAVVISKGKRSARLVIRRDIPSDPWLEQPLSLDTNYQFSQDKQQLASLGNHVVTLWDANTGGKLDALDALRDLSVLSGGAIDVSHDTWLQQRIDESAAQEFIQGQFRSYDGFITPELLVQSVDKAIFRQGPELWSIDLLVGKPLARMARDEKTPLGTAAFSADRRRVAISTERDVEVYEVETGRRVHKIPHGLTGTPQGTFYPTRTSVFVATVREDRLVVRGLDLATKRPSFSIEHPVHLSGMLSWWVSEQGSRLVAWSFNSYLVIDTRSSKVIRSLTMEQPNCVHVLQKRGELLVWRRDRMERVYLETGALLPELPLMPVTICNLVVNDDRPERPFALLTQPNQVSLVEPKNGHILNTITVPTEVAVVSLDVSSLGLLVTADRAATVRVQSLPNGELLDSFVHEGERVEFSPDSNWLWTSLPPMRGRLAPIVPFRLRRLEKQPDPG